MSNEQAGKATRMLMMHRVSCDTRMRTLARLHD